MKNIKRILSAALLVTMLLTSLPLTGVSASENMSETTVMAESVSDSDTKLENTEPSVSAANAITEGENHKDSTANNLAKIDSATVPYSYYISSNKAIITAYKANEEIVNIPETIDGYTVVGIDDNAFEYKGMHTVTMPDSITHINGYAFLNCASLKYVNLSKSLTYLGEGVFGGTAIESVEIPKSLKECDIGWEWYYTFNDVKYYIEAFGPFILCENLKTVTFEEGITKIPSNLFMTCMGIEEIVIPDTVTVIDAEAFKNCFRLRTVTIGNSVTTIEQAAFESCISLKNVTLSRTLTYLGASAFGYTAIESIEIPKSLKDCDIGWEMYYTFNGIKHYIEAYGPFAKCENLKTVKFEEGITKIPSNLFMSCMGIEEIVIPDTVTVIDEGAFENCFRLRTVKIGNSVTEINQCAFYRCISLINVTFPKSLTYLGAGAFGNTAIESIEIPKSLKECGTGWDISYTFNDVNYCIVSFGPFMYCENLKTVTFEKGITEIKANLFMGCVGIEEIVIPDTVTVIGSDAFHGCLRLSNVTLSNNLTTLEGSVFEQCVSLESIVIPDSVVTMENSIFTDCELLESVILPDGCVEISESTFYNCDSLKTVVFPENVENIGGFAFYNCDSLTTLDFPASLEIISEYAFYDCDSLESFTFSSGSVLKVIDWYSFYDCDALVSLDFGDNDILETIGSYAFYSCGSLKEAVLPDTLKTIYNRVFAYCTELERVVIPQSVNELGYASFIGCEKLSDITIEDYSITTIGSDTFMDCPALKKIVLPKGLTTIGSQAFMNDTGLTDVVIPQSVIYIDESAFSYPARTTIYGVAGSYAETFAKDGKFKFIDNSIPCEGIALLDFVEYIVLDIGERYRAVFEYYPEEHTDIVTLESSDGNVYFDGLDIIGEYSGDTVVTATAGDVSYEFTVHVRDPYYIEITDPADKLCFNVGDTFDSTGLKVQVVYDDGTTREITDYTLSGFDSSAEGTSTITIEWISVDGCEYYTEYTVEIVDPAPKLTGIVISRLPDKLLYERRQALDLTGMVVKALYTDGSEIEISDYTYSGYNVLKLGKQTITVKYGEFSATFEVEVVSHIHTWGDWVVTVEPTTETVGEETRTCNVCGATETQEVPMLEGTGPYIVGFDNYTVTMKNISNIKEIRFAIGTYTTSSQIKAAEKNVTLAASVVNKNTVDGTFTYDLPWVGSYTFWVRLNDGTNYWLYADLTEINPYVTSYGVKLTVNDFGENYKDAWLAKGTFNSYSEIKASTAFKYQASANKLANYAKTTHDFTYTMEDPGDYTVLIRYNDGTVDVIHHTLTVTTPVLVENGLQAIITNIPDIKIIRTAYGHYTDVAGIKKASTVRYFNNKTAIKDAPEYMIQYREEGEVTIIVEYNDGYKHYFYYNVAKKTPTYTLEGDTITFGDLDDLYIIRYAPGKYTTSNNIKNAPNAQYKKSDAIDENGEIVISGLTTGRWSFLVQYYDDSYNFYLLDIVVE